MKIMNHTQEGTRTCVVCAVSSWSSVFESSDLEPLDWKGVAANACERRVDDARRYLGESFLRIDLAHHRGSNRIAHVSTGVICGGAAEKVH